MAFTVASGGCAPFIYPACEHSRLKKLFGFLARGRIFYLLSKLMTSNVAACKVIWYSNHTQIQRECTSMSTAIIPTRNSPVTTVSSVIPVGAVAELVGIEGGVVSGVFNLESSGVEASDWRPRHDEQYHEA